MASLLTASKRLLILGLLATFPLAAWTQTFSPQGGEYALGALPGDQIFPSVSVNATGGYMVWEDNVLDGKGHGIGAIQLDNNFSPRYGAFRVNQQTVGDQEKPQVVMLKKGGAAIVWQGTGARYANIYARFLNSSGTFTSTNEIRVNTRTNSSQVNPALTVMTNGNVFVVWSSWTYSNSLMQDIRAQILTTNGTPVGTNFYVNGTDPSTPTELYHQRNPAVATLANGNIVVAWVSESQGLNSLQLLEGQNWIHIYARLYSPLGVPLGAEFRVNINPATLCANPAVSGTSDGGFTVVWSQKPLVKTPDGWDIYGRSFAADGSAGASAVRINSFPMGDQFGPSISTIGVNQLIIWSSLGQDGCWEGVFGKAFTQGLSNGQELRDSPLFVPEDFVNFPLLVSVLSGSTGAHNAVAQFLWGQFSGASKQVLTGSGLPLSLQQSTLVDQLNNVLQSGPVYDETRFAGVILTPETGYLLAQNPQGDELVRLNRMLIQDAFWSILPEDATPRPTCASPELMRKFKASINTTTISRQVYPAVASDGASRFLVTWSSFGAGTSFDLYAQRYAAGQPLPQPSAPFVCALSQSQLGVTWPTLSGFPLSSYEVYQDGSPTPASTTSNMWVAGGLGPSSTHWFQLAFVLAGGQRSPLSPPATNTTWGPDVKGQNGFPDGLPDNWQQLYFGTKTTDWDGPGVDSDGDGASNWQEFLAGTNPRDPNSVLKMWVTTSLQGRRLSWNTVAGAVYQIEVTTDFQNWNNVGAARFAAGTTDSMLITGPQTLSYYRVVRVQ